LRPGVDQRLLDWAISVIGVIVFVGLTAYDTQRIKEMYDVNDDGTISGRKAAMGALRLYLDFMHGDRERPFGGALTRMAGLWHPISSSTYHISPKRRQWLLLLHRLTMAWYES
jgi:hypothetical protein